jgi:hypothetical protein
MSTHRPQKGFWPMVAETVAWSTLLFGGLLLIAVQIGAL